MGPRDASFLGAAFLAVICEIPACAGRCGSAGATQAPATSSVTLPAGTVLYLRLRVPVSTKASHLRAAIAAEVVRDVPGSKSVAIPVGAILRGQIAKLIPSSSPDDRARVLLRFNRLELPDHTSLGLTGHVTEFENARETVLGDGVIQGLLASELPLAHLEKAVGKIGAAGSELEKLQQKALGRSDTSIEFPAGTDLELRLDQPLTISAQYAPTVAESLAPPLRTALDQFLAGAPLRASSKEGAAGDPLNLLVIGSQAQIRKAFADAGWSEAEQKNAKSIWDTVRAVVAEQGYPAAPVSQLYLFGHPEDLAFEKMLNTFMKRHHLRLWHAPLRSPDGREVWLGAATHDTGLDVRPGVISHAIDPNLDAERDKVGADLAVSGRVASELPLTRSNPLSEGLTATGAPWKTDGRILAIELKPQ